ncbi:MAG TPA: TetR/AcrR family transcriptional regulator [Candidatus Acidoferrales bacterium]|nr:TetR/AcrR family transcriptional regulator [Candidatus Acidoferrales bacterium]
MSSDEIERRERIIAKAEEMFLEHGYSRVTMEEIASSLGMSKKTLYKFFPNKEAILRELVSQRQCEFTERIDEIWQQADIDFVGKLRKTLDFFAERTSRVNRFHDLQKQIPDLWKEICAFKNEKGTEKIRQLLSIGFESGIIRNDLGRDIIILLYTNAVESMMNPELLSELPYSGPQIFEAISKIVFEGILSEEGRKKYVSYGTDEKQSQVNNAVEN